MNGPAAYLESSGVTRKEEDMTQGLSTTELVTAILLLAVLTLAGVQLGPIAIERWF